jgi:hypothetical protein
MQNILISKANQVFQKSDTTELPEQPTMQKNLSV